MLLFGDSNDELDAMKLSVLSFDLKRKICLRTNLRRNYYIISRHPSAFAPLSTYHALHKTRCVLSTTLKLRGKSEECEENKATTSAEN